MQAFDEDFYALGNERLCLTCVQCVFRADWCLGVGKGVVCFSTQILLGCESARKAVTESASFPSGFVWGQGVWVVMVLLGANK